MKLYHGELDSRRMRRKWIKEVCWEALGVVVTLAALWAFVVLMYVM